MPSSAWSSDVRSEEHTSELQSHDNLVCRLLLEKKNRDLVLSQRHQSVLVRSQLPEVEPVRVDFFFFNDPATPEIYPLPLHAALPISARLLAPAAKNCAHSASSGATSASSRC